jgi:hypothetical protein
MTNKKHMKMILDCDTEYELLNPEKKFNKRSWFK